MAKTEQEYKLTEDQKQLAEANFNLVYWHMAKKTMPEGIDWDDYQSYLIRWYLRSIVTFDPSKAKVSTYVCKMLSWSRLHYITQYVRTKKTGTTSIDGVEGDQIEIPVWDDQDRRMLNEESKACLDKLLPTIGPVREKILRQYMGGQSIASIARGLGISGQRVSQIVERSILIMRKIAQDRGIKNPLEVA